MAQSQLVIRYLLMVGIPLSVVLVILETGKGITAPPPIAGEWRLEPAAVPAEGSCPVESLFSRGNTFTLEQAGQFLTLRAANTLYGKIDGNVVWLQPEAATGQSVTARLVRRHEYLLLEGTMSDSSPGACAPVAFSASLVSGTVKARPAGSH